MGVTPRRAIPFIALVVSLIAIVPSSPSTRPTVDYDIVYVRVKRTGDSQAVSLPEVFDPFRIPPGGDLMLLRPDGTEEVLLPGGHGSIVDPYVSFDGQWVYYARFHDLRPSALNPSLRNAPLKGSDIYKIHIRTRRVVRLTSQESSPNTNGAENHVGYGVLNLGPCPLPGGKVMFTSSRNGFLPSKGYTFPTLQLFVMDEDGKNVEQVGHLNLGSALHPTILTDGRVMFASYESQGLRGAHLWALWGIWPDGRHWEPLMSAFTDAAGGAFHSHTQLSNGHLAVVEYYNLNNNGFGTLLAFPSRPPAGVPRFGDANPSHPSNPAIQRGLWFLAPGQEAHLKPRYKQYPFSPHGLYSLTPFTHGEDDAASRSAEGDWAGKVTHPSGAPADDVLLVWTPGPANNLNRPTNVPVYDAGLYLLRGGVPLTSHRGLVPVKNSPDYNEIQPRAVVPYRRIYGVDEPVRLPWLPNDGREASELPAGTPFGLVGASSFYKRDTRPGKGNPRFDGLEAFNTTENGDSTNWNVQGADAGRYTNADIHAVRILAMEPSSQRPEGQSFRNHANERLRILGEIPLRKFDAAGNAVRDGDGNPDTSFLAKIPADVPFTFQTLDKDGLVLNMSQTWHQVRPGEVRHDCGGCHAHSQLGTDFAKTAAARPGYKIHDLTGATPLLGKDGAGNPVIVTRPVGAVDVEYYRDIKPLLQRSCVQCHSSRGRAEAQLVLDDTSVVDGFENTYHRLANDTAAKYGIPPVISNRSWRQNNVSRYVRAFQSRRSLLVWKVFGRRLDGWTNEDHPTESVPGDPKTLPPGVNPNHADIDFRGSACPPPGSSVPSLTEDEKLRFARWVDLGAPITSPESLRRKTGWFLDELRPTLTLSLPRAGRTTAPLDSIRIGAFDYYSGLDRKSLSVKASFALNRAPAGTELASLFAESGDHVWTMAVDPPLTSLASGVIVVSIRDRQGNTSRIERTVSVEADQAADTPARSPGASAAPARRSAASRTSLESPPPSR
jgi:hypothetical protein